MHLRIIEDETRILSDQDAARADEQLAEAARDKSFGQLRYFAHRLVLKLDPDAAARRKEAAGRDAHVRRFREDSGNAGMIARELPSDEVLASWQHVEQRALDLRAAGLRGTLQELRVQAYLDLLQERDSRATAGAAAETAAGFGLLDAADARALIAAASRSPGTRWCVTALHPDGTAAAHGCAAGPRPLPLGPDGGGDHEPPGPLIPKDFNAVQILSALNIKLTLVIRGPCDHGQAKPRYQPSRKLRHRVTARNTHCTAPGCSRPGRPVRSRSHAALAQRRGNVQV